MSSRQPPSQIYTGMSQSFGDTADTGLRVQKKSVPYTGIVLVMLEEIAPLRLLRMIVSQESKAPAYRRRGPDQIGGLMTHLIP